jgi:hypothetical protein
MRHNMDVQEGVLSLWRTKCEVQLEMLGVCNSNDLFTYVPKTEHKQDCPFTITAPAYSAGQYYVTPGCLVWVKDVGGGKFYNPSHDPPRFLGKSFTIDELQQQEKCVVPFDMRKTGKNDALGTWPIVFNSVDDVANTAHAALVTQLSQWQIDGRGGAVPWRLESDFVEKVVIIFALFSMLSTVSY